MDKMTYQEAKQVFSDLHTRAHEIIRKRGVTHSEGYQMASAELGDRYREANRVVHSSANPNWTGKQRRTRDKSNSKPQERTPFNVIEGRYRRVADRGFVLTDEDMAILMDEKPGFIAQLRQELSEAGYDFVATKDSNGKQIGYAVSSLKDELMRKLNALQAELDKLNKDLYG